MMTFTVNYYVIAFLRHFVTNFYAQLLIRKCVNFSSLLFYVYHTYLMRSFVLSFICLISHRSFWDFNNNLTMHFMVNWGFDCYYRHQNPFSFHCFYFGIVNFHYENFNDFLKLISFYIFISIFEIKRFANLKKLITVECFWKKQETHAHNLHIQMAGLNLLLWYLYGPSLWFYLRYIVVSS